jgi:hypothetical protein
MARFVYDRYGTDSLVGYMVSIMEYDDPAVVSSLVLAIGDVPPQLSSAAVWNPILRRRRLDVKKRFSEEQIIGFLKEADAGVPIKELCRRHGFSDASYYLCRASSAAWTCRTPSG